MSGDNLKDYYYILGLARNASSDEIKTAYRKLSLKFHPDQNSGDKFFEERFKDIQEAYDTLSDELQRKYYDERLNAGNAPNTQAATEPVPPIIPIRKKNKLKQTLYGLIALIVFSSPAWLQPLIHKLNEEEQAAKRKKEEVKDIERPKKDEVPDPSKKDTSNDVVLLRMIYDSSETSASDNSTATNKEATDSTIDDEGLTAQDVLNRFFAALSNKNCQAAWETTYVTSWVNLGEDWFCSSSAFGTVTGMMVYETKPVEITSTHASFYAEYYAEDSYNGNKCFKQLIFFQKLEYTDGKWRWKMTRMRNNTDPVDCDGF